MKKTKKKTVKKVLKLIREASACRGCSTYLETDNLGSSTPDNWSSGLIKRVSKAVDKYQDKKAD